MIAAIIVTCLTMCGLIVTLIILANRNEELYNRVKELEQRERDRQNINTQKAA